MIIDVVANKGDKLAVNALKKALNLANKENWWIQRQIDMKWFNFFTYLFFKLDY